jgi:hypothetical protein
MTDGLIAGLVAVVVAVVAPVILSYLNNRARAREAMAAAATALTAAEAAAAIRRQEKQEDWDRLDAVKRAADEVASKAAEAAQLLFESQERIAAKADQVAEVAAQTDANLNAQLISLGDQTRQIHTLVNSDMTAARQLALDQMRISHGLLIRAAGPDQTQWSPDDQESIAELDKRIDDQVRILADRLAAQHRVEADVESMRLSAEAAVLVKSEADGE